MVSTAPAVKQAADDKLSLLSVELAVTTDSTVRLALSPKQQTTSHAETAGVAPVKAAKGAKDQAKPPAASGKAGAKKAGLYAPGAGKRSDLTFLDPMNKADCPPKAIALAAGELVLRIREEKRRRQVGGVDGKTPLPAVRMHGGSPGTRRDMTMCRLYAVPCHVACAVSSKRLTMAEEYLSSCQGSKTPATSCDLQNRCVKQGCWVDGGHVWTVGIRT